MDEYRKWPLTRASALLQVLLSFADLYEEVGLKPPYDFHLYNVRTLVQAFPKLEELTVRGTIFASLYRSPSDDTDEESVTNPQESDSLTSLDLSHAVNFMGVSRLEKNVKDLGKLKAISSQSAASTTDVMSFLRTPSPNGRVCRAYIWTS
jgi:hypothetical protein